MKRRLCDWQESCCVKRRNVPESVVEAAGLAVELIDDATVTMSGVIEVADPRIDVLRGQSVSSKAEVTSLTSMM